MAATRKNRAIIIGGGLAGVESAYFLLKKGYEVHLYERRPLVDDRAHETDLLGELVCSNSLKSKKLDNACGLLKEEMRHLGSLTMEAAFYSEVPSGNALSVDRHLFASFITEKLRSFPNFHLHVEEVQNLDFEELAILATGPLTDGPLMRKLEEKCGSRNLAFFDASAPIVSKDSIDFSKAYFKSRYEQGDDSYINCPFEKDEYLSFVKELVAAKKALLHSFDTEYFESCLPIEVIASRGEQTLRHGPMKPFGLRRSKEERTPYAVVQLRQDDRLGNYYNLVGFQTNLTYPEQKRVFRMIPGLEKAEFLRYGLMHRNSYINAPSSLSHDLSLKAQPNVFVAGQLSGVEGYVESSALGIVAAINLMRRNESKGFVAVPKATVLGSLIDYILSASSKSFAPMNANWALLNVKREDREEAIKKALLAIDEYKDKVNG